jgi:hypothetical protein
MACGRKSERRDMSFVTMRLCMIGCCLIQSAFAQSLPFPPSRPPDLSSATPFKPETPAKSGSGQVATPDPSVPMDPACASDLALLGLIGEAVTTPTGDTIACRVRDPIRLLTMRYKDRTVAFPDRPILDCRAAHALGLWLREVVLPLAEIKFGSPVAALETGPGFDCRNRNRAATGKLSAHASGLALDVARMRFADKTTLVIEKPKDEAQKQFLDTLRRSACGWFTTVLGPGSDAAHFDHLHLDVELRGSNGTGRFCQ